MALLQGLAGLAQMAGTDVQSHVGLGIQLLQQGADFSGAASSEFHQHPGAQSPGQLRCPLQQQGRFGAGEAVFRLFADGVEQLGALVVVEEPGRQLAGLALHAGHHQAVHVGGRWMQIDQLRISDGKRGRHQRARRRPAAIHRLAGGKKLR